MKKTCTKCGREQPLESFAKNQSKKDGLQSHCRQCKKKVDALHYKTYKNQQIERNKKNRNKLKDQVDQFKAEIGCAYCEEFDACCLDFHHEDGNKENSVSQMLWSVSKNKMILEIQKCEVVCASCHRKYHAGRKLKRRRKRVRGVAEAFLTLNQAGVSSNLTGHTEWEASVTDSTAPSEGARTVQLRAAPLMIFDNLENTKHASVADK